MSNQAFFQVFDSLAERIRACCSDGIMEPVDSAVILKAISEAARANGMAKTARDAGMTRAGLYKALSEDGNPSFTTVWNILSAFGYMLIPVRIDRKDITAYSGGGNEDIR